MRPARVPVAIIGGRLVTRRIRERAVGGDRVVVGPRIDETPHIRKTVVTRLTERRSRTSPGAGPGYQTEPRDSLLTDRTMGSRNPPAALDAETTTRMGNRHTRPAGESEGIA